jgi:small subunit ribosomal protein S1
VVVLKYDPSTERVSLGHKQLVPDPWATVQDRYPVGARMSGKVVSVTDYGAFVELEPGVEGLIHVSEMSWSKRVKHPSKILNVGDSVEAMVLGVDQAARRISLGLKQVESNPWHELAEKYPVGTRIKGKVRNLTEFGAFVEVEEDIDGLIHISDMSWSKCSRRATSWRRWCSVSMLRISGFLWASSSSPPTSGTTSSAGITSETPSRAR